MKIIGCGSRDTQQFTVHQLKGLTSLHGAGRWTEVIVGSTRGTDHLLRVWAEVAGIDTVVFFPNFAGYGKAGGPRRNTRQLEYLLWQCTRHGETPGCVVFPGGNGTADMAAQARQAGCYMIPWNDRTQVFDLEGIHR